MIFSPLTALIASIFLEAYPSGRLVVIYLLPAPINSIVGSCFNILDSWQGTADRWPKERERKHKRGKIRWEGSTNREWRKQGVHRCDAIAVISPATHEAKALSIEELAHHVESIPRSTHIYSHFPISMTLCLVANSRIAWQNTRMQSSILASESNTPDMEKMVFTILRRSA